MIQLISDYWRPYLYSDGFHMTGLAVTLWMLVLSISIGFCLAVPLAVARVSKRKCLSGPVRMYTFVFRGTPLYVQLLFFYSGVYSLGIVRDTEFLNLFFRQGFELHDSGLRSQYLRLYDGSDCWCDSGDAQRRNRSRTCIWHVTVLALPQDHFAGRIATRIAGPVE